jgi:hypothetical protein
MPKSRINTRSENLVDIKGRYIHRYAFMASIHRHPRNKSPFWYCAFYGADGRRMFKTTKEPDRKAALKICFGWERAAELARRKELTAAQGRRVIAEMVAISSGEAMHFYTIEGWLSEILANKGDGVAERTMLRYRQVFSRFSGIPRACARQSLNRFCISRRPHRFS